MCVHRVCNQAGGTAYGFLCDGTDQMTVHVGGDRDARMPEQLANHCDIGTGGQHQWRRSASGRGSSTAGVPRP
ncbi:MAG TPA: hypothetical protein VFM91_05620, partial [Propionibacteriaceae bacterium]|nr:hypothetical protein [Propionibacteriaceae bacterium]